jgi:hypothetical protein
VAFVPGSKAASYKFTSALAVQIFKDIEPQLKTLLLERDQPQLRTLPSLLAGNELSKNERPNPASSIQR